MDEGTLARLEIEVESARAKVAAGLALLTSEETLSNLRETVQAESYAAKDRLWEAGQKEVRSRVDTLVETAKAKAAANPLAVAAIGAGVAYRLFRHPPIASVLVGAGLYSLLTTDSRERPFIERYGLDEAADLVRARAEDAGEFVAETSHAAVEKSKDLAQRARATAENIAHEATERLSDVKQHLSLAEPNGVGNRAHYSAEAPKAVSSQQADRALLGFAGLAVAAALGMAFRRRAEYSQST
jgi:hypothetical protein